LQWPVLLDGVTVCFRAFPDEIERSWTPFFPSGRSCSYAYKKRNCPERSATVCLCPKAGKAGAAASAIKAYRSAPVVFVCWSQPLFSLLVYSFWARSIALWGPLEQLPKTKIASVTPAYPIMAWYRRYRRSA